MLRVSGQEEYITLIVLLQTLITAIICLIGFAIGTVYVTPGGQAILELVDYFGGGFIIFVIAIIEVVAVRWVNTTSQQLD